MPLAVALAVVLVAGVGYLKRYEIAVGATSLLHVWKRMIRTFRRRHSLAKEYRGGEEQSEALNEEGPNV